MAIDPQLLKRVLESPQLPSLPTIALQIISLVQEDEVDIDQIAEAISLDPALSSKLLKTVNSSFYGLPKTVGSVHQAVMVLGLNSVKTLALGFSLVSNLTNAGGEGFNHMGFWRRSLYCATAAKQLCEQLHIVQAEEVFMASLLQDVGVLALAQVLDAEYAGIIKQSAGDHRKLSAAERAGLGGDHTEIGAELAESWGLPPLLVESIRLHERPDDAPENLRPLIRTVYAGALAAELIEHPDDEERVGDYHRVMGEWFEMQQADAEALLKQVFKLASETQRLFELPTGELGHAEDILTRANQALERLSLACARASDSSGDGEASNPPETHLDPVTGLLNRRQFEEQLDERFLISSAAEPLSVILIDLDGSRPVNDTHGQPVGDAALRTIAQAVRAVLGGKGDCFHFEGDAFAALCPGLSREEAALLAEQARVHIQQTPCRAGQGAAEQITMTASLGVATYEGSVFKRPEQLLKAANKGVRAAKQGGRNCVRVFVPRPADSTKAA